MKKRSSNYQPLVRFLFVIYGLVMLWLLFGRSSGWVEGLSYREMLSQNINLNPFYTIRNYWHVVAHRTNDALLLHCIINLGGNIFLFVPLGWWIPSIFKAQRRFWLFFFTCLFFDLLVEVTQLLTLLGSFDIDDVILNMLGFILGYLGYRLTHRSSKKK